MPILDHFAPPLSTSRHWESFHAGWAEQLAQQLNEILPPGYVAEPHAHHGPRVEIDVASFRGRGSQVDPVAPPQPAGRAAPFEAARPTGSITATYPDEFEVVVRRAGAFEDLVAAIELVSPGNKDRPDTRQAFVAKCTSYLVQGMGLVVCDIVTERRARLHDELVALIDPGAHGRLLLPPGVDVWCAAYRPVRERDRDQVELWVYPLALGAQLPADVPLWLDATTAIPVDFERAYASTCRAHRIDMARLAHAHD